MRRLLLLKLFYISACITVYAQSVIRFQGSVLREGNSPIPGASIMLYRFQTAADSTLAAFAIADKDGNFNLTINSTAIAYRLTVRAMNYAEQSQKFEGTDKSKLFRFVLQPQVLVLNDVVVRASKSVQEDGDTTIYRVAAFRTGEERTVEDILKKLPGISVDEQGKIRVQGKLIDGVLIEGEDLLSKNYRLITRSLDADAIDKIEAINNHTDRPMLREVEKSGKTVLNLTIKKNRLLKPLGNAGLALGSP